MSPWLLLARLDAAVAAWMNLHRTPAVTAVMLFLTNLGGPVGMTILGAIIVGLIFWRRGPRPALTLAGALAGSALLNKLLKAWFHRARPGGDWLTPEAGYSFPSGHSMSSMAFFLVLGIILSAGVARRRDRSLIVGAGLVLSLLIGISRIYLGVHYASDVLAGFLAGAVWGLVCLIPTRESAKA